MGWRARAGRYGLASVAVALPLVVSHVVTAQPVGAQMVAARPIGAQRATEEAAPSTHLKKGVCLVSGVPSVVPGTGPLVIAPYPTGVKILWLPGLNSTACVIATTHAGASTAEALGRAITHAPAVSHGAELSCPEDDDSRASISFTYAPHRSAPQVVVQLSGCRLIGQSGREQRSMTSGINNRLAALAPCGWRTDVADSPRGC